MLCPTLLCIPLLYHLQAFFAQIYSEAQSSRAAPGHVAIAELHKMGRIQRHYTLNIDGLAAVRAASSGLCSTSSSSGSRSSS